MQNKEDEDQVVPSVLTTRATASLEASVEKDLKVEDPEDKDKAKAFLQDNEEQD